MVNPDEKRRVIRELALRLRATPNITKYHESLLKKALNQIKKDITENPKDIVATRQLVREIIATSSAALEGDEKDSKILAEARRTGEHKPIVDPLALTDPDAIVNQALAPWVVANYLLHAHNEKISRYPPIFRIKSVESVRRHLMGLKSELEEYMLKYAIPKTITATGYIRNADRSDETSAKYHQQSAPKKIKMMHDAFSVLATATMALYGDDDAKKALQRYLEEIAIRATLVNKGEVPPVEDVNRILLAAEILNKYGKKLGVSKDMRLKIKRAAERI